MRKHLVFFFAALVLIMAVVSPTAQAVGAYAPTDNRQTITYFEDGSYIISEIKEFPTQKALLSASTKNGSKTSTGYSASGKKLFSLTVHGSFSYDGRSAQATDSSYSYTVDASGYSFGSGSSSCSGATASATGTFQYLHQSKTISASLTCAKDGRLS